jgi:hypothetical protein
MVLGVNALLIHETTMKCKLGHIPNFMHLRERKGMQELQDGIKGM